MAHSGHRPYKFVSDLEFVDHLVQHDEIDPSEPTDYRPGSEEKIAVLARRYDQGLPMHISGDRNSLDRRAKVGSRPAEHRHPKHYLKDR